jgi:hypothetical protein
MANTNTVLMNLIGDRDDIPSSDGQIIAVKIISKS